jgi:glutamine---fructose-6-phosphate transaminase (isomerizing)
VSNGDLLMLEELRESPEVLRRQTDLLRGPISELCKALAIIQPNIVVTCGRGSSAYAAAFGKHLIERYLGLPVAAAAPSIATIYGRKLHLKGQLFLAISQSGRSDDLVETTVSAKQAGALTAAIVNDVGSPLAEACDIVLPMAAGPELSVAATKTFIASLSALLNLVASWAGELPLQAALARLPTRLTEATYLDWSNAVSPMSRVESMVALGRGPTFAIAQEAALKFKEICNLHAEAYSGAEFQHGPIALVERDYPILVLSAEADRADALAALAAQLCRKGAAVFATGPQLCPDAIQLPMLAGDHPATDSVCLIQSVYQLAVELATHRGLDADQPRNLQKVTRTR